MRFWLPGSVLGLSLIVVGVGVAAEPPGQAEVKATWLTDYAAAKAAAQRSGKPIFVVFR